MAGCCGAPGIITNALGAKNVFDDSTQKWPQINWETVADRDPDVLVSATSPASRRPPSRPRRSLRSWSRIRRRRT